MSLIEVNNASFTYPNGFEAVQNVDLTVEAGDNIAIIGQNGAGKTTTVKMLNGLLKPTSGDVVVDGKNTKDHSTAQVSKQVGYVFQNPDDQIFNNDVYDEIAYALTKSDYSEEDIKGRVFKYAKLCGVDDLINENPYDLPLSVRKLVTIASVIATDAKVIILDEPTAGQDKIGLEIIANVLQTLTEENRAVITITHDMEFVANNFDKVIVMADKRIRATGDAEDIFYDDATMEIASLKPPMIVRVVQELGLNIKTLDAKILAQAIKTR